MSSNAFNQCAADVERTAEQREIHQAERRAEMESIEKESMLAHLDIQNPAPSTALSVTVRAALAIGSSKHEAQLINLAEGSKAIVSITNTDGYKECHATRMTLRNARIAVEKTSKVARDDATAFSKAVIAEEKRLVAIVEPDETRLKELQDVWVAALEAEKQRLIAEEAARVAAIKEKIEAFQRAVLTAIGKSSAELRQAIDDLDAAQIDESFAEHLAYAALVKGDAIKALSSMLLGALEAEAEQERIAKEREELAVLREQQRIDAEQAAEDQRIRAAAETARLTQEREEAYRKEFAARAALQQQQEESARLTQEIARLKKAETDRIAAEQKAEADRLAEEQRGKAQCIAEEQQAAAKRAADELEAANRLAQAVAEQDNEARISASMPVLVQVVPEVESLDRPSDEEIIAVIADHFDVSNATAYEWITSITTFQQFAAEVEALAA